MYYVVNNAVQNHINKYGITPRTVPNHWVLWVGWADQAKINADNNLYLDCNYYHYDRESKYGHFLGGPGNYNGSGLIMKFIDESGQVQDTYQSNTQLPDEMWKHEIFNSFKTILDRSLDQETYTFINVNFHPTNQWDPQLMFRRDLGQVLDYANQRAVPVCTAEHVLDFLQMRDSVRFDNITWSNNKLSFQLLVSPTGENLTFMVPDEHMGMSLDDIKANGTNQSFTLRKIKGKFYAMVTIKSGTTYSIEADNNPHKVNDERKKLIFWIGLIILSGISGIILKTRLK